MSGDRYGITPYSVARPNNAFGENCSKNDDLRLFSDSQMTASGSPPHDVQAPTFLSPQPKSASAHGTTAIGDPAVASLLDSFGLTRYGPILADEEVNMEALMLMDEPHLQTLGFKMGPRLLILEFAQQWRADRSTQKCTSVSKLSTPLKDIRASHIATITPSPESAVQTSIYSLTPANPPVLENAAAAASPQNSPSPTRTTTPLVTASESVVAAPPQHPPPPTHPTIPSVTASESAVNHSLPPTHPTLPLVTASESVVAAPPHHPPPPTHSNISSYTESQLWRMEHEQPQLWLQLQHQHLQQQFQQQLHPWQQQLQQQHPSLSSVPPANPCVNSHSTVASPPRESPEESSNQRHNETYTVYDVMRSYNFLCVGDPCSRCGTPLVSVVPDVVLSSPPLNDPIPNPEGFPPLTPSMTFAQLISTRHGVRCPTPGRHYPFTNDGSVLNRGPLPNSYLDQSCPSILCDCDGCEDNFGYILAELGFFGDEIGAVDDSFICSRINLINRIRAELHLRLPAMPPPPSRQKPHRRHRRHRHYQQDLPPLPPPKASLPISSLSSIPHHPDRLPPPPTPLPPRPFPLPTAPIPSQAAEGKEWNVKWKKLCRKDYHPDQPPPHPFDSWDEYNDSYRHYHAICHGPNLRSPQVAESKHVSTPPPAHFSDDPDPDLDHLFFESEHGEISNDGRLGCFDFLEDDNFIEDDLMKKPSPQPPYTDAGMLLQPADPSPTPPLPPRPPPLVGDGTLRHQLLGRPPDDPAPAEFLGPLPLTSHTLRPPTGAPVPCGFGAGKSTVMDTVAPQIYFKQQTPPRKSSLVSADPGLFPLKDRLPDESGPASPFVLPLTYHARTQERAKQTNISPHSAAAIYDGP